MTALTIQEKDLLGGMLCFLQVILELLVFKYGSTEHGVIRPMRP